MGKLKNKRKRKKYVKEVSQRSILFGKIVNFIKHDLIVYVFLIFLVFVVYKIFWDQLKVSLVDEYGKHATAIIVDSYYKKKRNPHKGGGGPYIVEVREYEFSCEGSTYSGMLKLHKEAKENFQIVKFMGFEIRIVKSIDYNVQVAELKDLQIGDSLDIRYIEKCPFLNASVIEIEKFRSK
ncbi:MAG: hypothetical protein UF067_05395 [Paludibacteraceae bacterium]|nr:hypothetical protein [Paludibacteraceae bacterium]